MPTTTPSLTTSPEGKKEILLNNNLSRDDDNDDEDDDDIIKLEMSQYRFEMHIALAKKEVPNFSCAKNILIKIYLFSLYFLSVYNQASPDYDAYR